MRQVWLITGCSTGFGRLLVQKLLDTDAKIVATARRAESMDDLGHEDDERLLRLPLDVTRGEQIRTTVAKALDRFGRVDVLVNNAGYGYFGTQEEGDIDDIRRMFETNVFGLVRMTQAVLPTMREQKSGAIVNLSSIAGRVAFPRSGFYNASKWAVEAMSEALYYEVSPFGVRVIVIEPGAYDTDFGPRSAVRSAALEVPNSPYAELVEEWTEAASRIFPPKRQAPIEVVQGILDAVASDRLFVRRPFGTDATALVARREGRPDAEYMESMARDFGFGRTTE